MSNPTMIVRPTITRSGPRMRIVGFSLDNQPVKVWTDLIEGPAGDRTYWRAADHKTGQQYRLS